MKLSTFLISVSLIAALILFRAGMHVSREDAEIHSRPRRSSLLMGTPPSDRHLDPVLSGASQWQVPQVEPTTPATMPKMLRLQHTTRAPATAQPAPALRYAWEGVTHSGDESARCAAISACASMSTCSIVPVSFSRSPSTIATSPCFSATYKLHAKYPLRCKWQPISANGSQTSI